MLNPKQRQHLKAKAHHLKAVLQIGKGGVSAPLAAELDTMLDSLELVKVKLNEAGAGDTETVAAELCGRIEGLEHVWTIGHTLLLFRPSRTKATHYPLP